MTEEMTLFDFPKMEITKPIRLIELFGGIGSQAMALRDIGADFEHYRLVEFDKYAVESYNAIHGTNFETKDIRDVHGADLGIVETDKFTYLLTYSFPCTDLSVAGKMEGMSKKDWENGKSTRSGLLWEVERILKELPDEQLPQVLLMENVPQVHAEQNQDDFESWLKFLRSKGYHNFYKDLNAKDYGIPQGRYRCFCISVLSKDFVEYEFPMTVQLQKVMKDYLEETVDEKYYIKTEKAGKLIEQLLGEGVLPQNGDPVKQTLTLPKVIEETKCVGGMSDKKWGEKQFHQQDRVYKGDIALAHPSNLPGGSYKYIVAMRGREENKEKQRNAREIETVDLTLKNPRITNIANCIGAREDRSISKLNKTGNGVFEIIKENTCVAMRGRNPERPTDRTPGLHTEQRLEPNRDGLVNTLTTVQKDNLVLEKKIKKVEQISNEGSQCGTVVSEDGLAPTISAGCHGYANPHILAKENMNKFYEQAIETAERENAQPGDVVDAFNKKVLKDGISPTITTRPEGKKTAILPVTQQYRIRKLTPKECWRLMGYTDEDFEKAAKVNSNTQLYKQAGNAIVKQVLMAIFSQMNIKGVKPWNEV